MFTGLIDDIGTLLARDGHRFAIACRYDPAAILLGASIACDGACLTVVEVGPHDEGDGYRAVFFVEVSNETLSCTTLGNWEPGRRINLERALKLGDELGGHLVTGHVDGVATIAARKPDGESVRFEITPPPSLLPYIAAKGSVALDGTSLTVNEVSESQFGVNIVPHTLAVTTWGERSVGDRLNIEVDLLARYVARLGRFRLVHDC